MVDLDFKFLNFLKFFKFFKTSLILSVKADLAESVILKHEGEYWFLHVSDFWRCWKMFEFLSVEMCLFILVVRRRVVRQCSENCIPHKWMDTPHRTLALVERDLESWKGFLFKKQSKKTQV